MTCFKTCRGCREKDPTTTWSVKLHAMLCVACRIDRERILIADENESAVEYVRMSPAARLAMAEAQ